MAEYNLYHYTIHVGNVIYVQECTDSVVVVSTNLRLQTE